MLQKNIFLMLAIFCFSNSAYSKELIPFEEADRFVDSYFGVIKYDICNSVQYESKLKSENEDYITYTLAQLKDTAAPTEEPEPPISQIRKPTSVVIQDEHDYRETYRNNFQENADKLLFILNKNKSVSTKQFMNIKSRVAEFESQLRQGEEKLCSKADVITP